MARFTNIPVESERRHEKISANINGFRTDNETGANHTQNTDFKQSATELRTVTSSYSVNAFHDHHQSQSEVWQLGNK